MSFSKKDQVFPSKLGRLSETEFAQIVAHALRHDFGETPSAIKHIGKLTGANLRTIKNWYKAGNMPSSVHLLLLGRSSSTLLKFILEQLGGSDLRDAFGLLNGHMAGPKSGLESSLNEGIYSDNFVTINVVVDPEDDLNQRQLWFLGQLQEGIIVKTEDISDVWDVAGRTAKRDIADLIAKKIICFKGAKKTGKYEIQGKKQF